MQTASLHNAIAAVAPIQGVSIGNPDDKSTWRIVFDPSVTSEQTIAAQNVVSNFDFLKSDLTDYASTKRWIAETGGMIVGSITVPTDDRAKLLILGASLTLGDTDAAPFISNGLILGMITGAQFKSINSAVTAHVQGTFTILSTVLDGINNGTITSRAQIDSAFSD